jgi:hypothetical protein
MFPQSFQPLIYNGGQLSIIDCCFLSNAALRFGLVVTLGPAPVVQNTFGTVDPATECAFLAYFPETTPGQGLSNPTCIDYDATACANVAPSPTAALPPIIPTQAPCFTDLNGLTFLEDGVSNVSVPRVYILCPNTVFNTAGDGVQGSSPIVIRPNVSTLCGTSGRRSNNCVVTGGIGLSGTPLNFLDGSNIGSVFIRGITFRRLTDAVFFLGQWVGRVEVHDCAFLDSSAVPNIYLESSRTASRLLKTQEDAQDNIMDKKQQKIYDVVSEFIGDGRKLETGEPREL